jgi:hypothetical protein
MKYRSNRKKAWPLTCLGLLLILMIPGCSNPVSDDTGTTGVTGSAPPGAPSGGGEYLSENGNAVFTLTTSHEAEAVWKVYSQQAGGALRADAAASGYDTGTKKLTLAVTNDTLFGWPLYCWVSVTEPGKTESSRTLLTVTGPYTANGVTRPPAAASQAAVTVEKAAGTQGTVTFTLTSTQTGTWKVYDSSDNDSVISGVSASLSGTTLTLTASGGDLAPDDYYVSVTENGKSESARLHLIVTAYVPASQTPTPAAEVTAVNKGPGDQKSVTFTLINDPPYPQDAPWKVYSLAAGGQPLTTVSASLSGTALTLTASGADLAPAVYYVSVTQGELTESNRLALTAGAYVPPSPTDTPTVEFAVAAKTGSMQKAVDFTLTSTDDGAWKVYGGPDDVDVMAGVTASRSLSTLTLSASGADLASGDYYVSVTDTANGKTESLRLKLTVTAYVDTNQTPQPLVSESTVTKDTTTQQSVTFTLTSSDDGTWKVYADAGDTQEIDGVTASLADTTLTLSASGNDLAPGDYYVSVTVDEKDESPRLRLTVKNPLFGGIQLNFTGPADETITLSVIQTLSISANASINVTVTENFDSYAWYRDGVPVPEITQNYITVYATEFTKGIHTLSVKVSKNDKIHSKLVTFTVAD